ncbi:hypothetical protein [Neobacillus bataviensis]|uniref:hypothetical protein n=1 Tax=Neobacillus bataviensis TaxID=220685 RepID=UPI001CBD45D7|nr:hypothetical protein [Neobacillus bataviensis]
MMLTEKGFGLNDYFVIAAVFFSWIIYYFLPKIFSKQFTVLIFLYSLTISGIFDNSFGATPFDLYDIMDGPAYTVMDILVYFLYPPAGYIFLFLYKKLRIRDQHLVLFIPIFTAFSLGIEWIYHKMGVFKYKDGYNIIYSICIYLFVQSILVLLYRFLYNHGGERIATSKSRD